MAKVRSFQCYAGIVAMCVGMQGRSKQSGWFAGKGPILKALIGGCDLVLSSVSPNRERYALYKKFLDLLDEESV